MPGKQAAWAHLGPPREKVRQHLPMPQQRHAGDERRQRLHRNDHKLTLV
jgi:hypothetical protein